MNAKGKQKSSPWALIKVNISHEIHGWNTDFFKTINVNFDCQLNVNSRSLLFEVRRATRRKEPHTICFDYFTTMKTIISTMMTIGVNSRVGFVFVKHPSAGG